jgi:hypothetical protein
MFPNPICHVVLTLLLKWPLAGWMNRRSQPKSTATKKDNLQLELNQQKITGMAEWLPAAAKTGLRRLRSHGGELK